MWDFFDGLLDSFTSVGESAMSGLSSLASTGTGGKIIGSLVDAGTSALTNYASNALFGDPNQQAIEANQRAAAELSHAYEMQAQAIREGNEAAQEYYGRIISMADPAFNTIKTNAAMDPYQLNPIQQRSFDPSVERSQNALPFSMKGSGRAQTGAIQDIQQSALDSLYGQNLAVKRDASNLLAGKGYDAMGNAARGEINTANAAGAVLPKIGDVGASEILGSQAIRSKDIAGQADPFRASLENLSSFIKQDIKDQSKPEKYKDFKMSSGGSDRV